MLGEDEKWVSMENDMNSPIVGLFRKEFTYCSSHTVVFL